MKIDISINHKEYQPDVDGITSLPEGYTIHVTRSDGKGIKKHEALTTLQTAISGLEDSIQDSFGTMHGTTSMEETP